MTQEEQWNVTDSDDSVCNNVENDQLAEIVKNLTGLKLMLPGRLHWKKWHMRFRRIYS